MLVAGYHDYLRVSRRQVIFVEHGSGMVYDRNPSSPGGMGRERVILFLCPNEQVARKNLEAYPNSRAQVVGCPAIRPRPRPNNPEPKVALAWHWANKQVPESNTAFLHYVGVLKELAQEFEVLGHGHPRIFNRLIQEYERAGIRPVPDLEEVYDQANVICVDNSSILFEAMAMDIPVVILSAPWYRRDAYFPPRFWDCLEAGVHVEEPSDLIEGIRLALQDKSPIKEKRRQFGSSVYASVHDDASELAVNAILSLEGTPE